MKAIDVLVFRDKGHIDWYSTNLKISDYVNSTHKDLLPSEKAAIEASLQAETRKFVRKHGVKYLYIALHRFLRPKDEQSTNG